MNLAQWLAANPDWNDAKLAEAVGVSRPFITRIKRNERQPSLRVATKLAGITKLPTSAFLSEAA